MSVKTDAEVEIESLTISRDLWKGALEHRTKERDEAYWALMVIAKRLGLGPKDLAPIGEPDAFFSFGMQIDRALGEALSRGGATAESTATIPTPTLEDETPLGCTCPHLRNKPIVAKSRHLSRCPWSNQ